jgi:hypothetical protein
MATVDYWPYNWVSAGPAFDLPPGGPHWWELGGGDFKFGDVVTVSCHPVSGNPFESAGRHLSVEKMQIRPGPVLSFLVRNVGTSTIPGYAISVARIGE